MPTTVVTLKPVEQEKADVTACNTSNERKEEMSLQVETSLPVNENLREGKNRAPPVDLKHKSDVNEVVLDFPGIPVAVLRRLRGESETIVDVTQTIETGTARNIEVGAPASALSTPASSVTDLSDGAHLLKNQQKPAKQTTRDNSTRF